MLIVPRVTAKTYCQDIIPQIQKAMIALNLARRPPAVTAERFHSGGDRFKVRVKNIKCGRSPDWVRPLVGAFLNKFSKSSRNEK